jgi:hypothetical protein
VFSDQESKIQEIKGSCHVKSIQVAVQLSIIKSPVESFTHDSASQDATIEPDNKEVSTIQESATVGTSRVDIPVSVCATCIRLSEVGLACKLSDTSQDPTSCAFQ